MGLAWQQGPLAPGGWIADSEDIVLLHEPGRYPVAWTAMDAFYESVVPHGPDRDLSTDEIAQR
jgi:hypothetical protein